MRVDALPDATLVSAAPRHRTLAAWLAWQECLHPNAIDLGLERVQSMLARLAWQRPAIPVITIAGTKGKGSAASLAESILGAAGHRVGLLTSPHLRHYNERIRIAGVEVSDASLCAAFERIDAARGDLSLTYFEFNLLAALLVFASACVDVLVLEVGLGGRLDAVNVVDADVAIVTSIGLDHTEWLGTDLESIGREKAGIFRHGRPALFGAAQMPSSIAEVAERVGAPLLRAEQDFSFTQQGAVWHWQMQDRQLDHLPMPGIAGEVQLWNASVVLAALKLLAEQLPVDHQAIVEGLRQAHLPGRFQIVPQAAEWILDVAHNALSATVFAAHLRARDARSGGSTPGTRPRTVAVLGLLADKDVAGILAAMSAEVDVWVVSSVASPRALQASALAQQLRAAGCVVSAECATPIEALQHAEQQAAAGERVLVFGSFLIVGPALEWLKL